MRFKEQMASASPPTAVISFIQRSEVNSSGKNSLHKNAVTSVTGKHRQVRVTLWSDKFDMAISKLNLWRGVLVGPVKGSVYAHDSPRFQWVISHGFRRFAPRNCCCNHNHRPLLIPGPCLPACSYLKTIWFKVSSSCVLWEFFLANIGLKYCTILHLAATACSL